MKFLLDTHTFIWFIQDDPRLSANARRLIEDDGSIIFLSIASVWEIAIKLNTGKLQLGGAFEDVFPRQLELNLIDLLPLELSHLA